MGVVALSGRDGATSLGAIGSGRVVCVGREMRIAGVSTRGRVGSGGRGATQVAEV